jgi:ABC-type spermidine/putrescine transport system permease subunit II
MAHHFLITVLLVLPEIQMVLARLQDFKFQNVGAARDLGATRLLAFWKVVLPLIARNFRGWVVGVHAFHR